MNKGSKCKFTIKSTVGNSRFYNGKKTMPTCGNTERDVCINCDEI